MNQTVKAARKRCERFGALRVYSYTFKRYEQPMRPFARRAGVVLV
ncbi:MAG TPA: hypothetical protein VIY48_19095 [Candidatus Paceibacterota bacterium]